MEEALASSYVGSVSAVATWELCVRTWKSLEWMLSLVSRREIEIFCHKDLSRFYQEELSRNCVTC